MELAAAVGADHLEGGLAALAGVVALEQRAHAHHHRRRPVNALDGADHRAAAALQQAEGGAHGEGRLALGHRGEVDVELALAGFVEGGFIQLAAAPGAVLVGVAELEAGELGCERVLLPFVLHHAEQAVAGGRGAVEVAALHGQREGLFCVEAGVAGGEVELHALGQELLDVEAVGVGGQLVGRVGPQFERPGAGGGVGGELDGAPVVAAEARFGLPAGGELALAVGPLEDGLHRLGRHRAAVGVAGQHGQLEALAGPVEVAARPREEPYRPPGQAGDVELGEVEGRLAGGDQGELLALAGHHHAGVPGALGEAGAAVAVGLAAGQHLAGRVEPLDLHVAPALAVGEGADHRVGALVEQAQVQAQVADVEVAHLVVVAEAVGLAHHGDVDAGLLEFLDVLDRDEGDAAPVGLLLGDEAAGVDAVGEAVQAVELPVADGAAQAQAAVLVIVAVVPGVAVVVALAVRCGLPGSGRADHAVEEARQLVGPHAQELDVHLGHIDGDHRQAAVLLGGQHHAAAGEVVGRRDGGGADRKARLGVEPGVVPGRQPGGHLDHVAGLGLHVGEEQQARVVAHRPGAFDPLATLGVDILGFAAGYGRGVLARVLIAFALVAGGEHLALPGRHLEHLDLAVVGVARVEGLAEGQGEGGGAVEVAVGQFDQPEGAVTAAGFVARRRALEVVEPGGQGDGQRDQDGDQGKAPAGGGDHGLLPFGRAPPGADSHDVEIQPPIYTTTACRWPGWRRPRAPPGRSAPGLAGARATYNPPDEARLPAHPSGLPVARQRRHGESLLPRCRGASFRD